MKEKTIIKRMALFYIVVVCILLVNENLSGKIDPLLQSLKAQQKESIRTTLGLDGLEYVSSPIPLANLKNIIDISQDKGELTVYTIIQTDGEFEEFSHFGIRTNTKIGNFYTAELTMDQIDSLAAQKGIIRIDASVKCKLNLDTSLTTMKVDAAIDTFGLTGKGVIIGVIDAGFDIWNPDFQKQNDTTTRILYYFDVDDNSGPSPLSYGTEFNSSQINSFSCGHLDFDGHGTAVAGIACGNGKKTKNAVLSGTFKGVAPEASIIIFDFVNEQYMSTGKILDGIGYIMQKSTLLNMPCVINLSAGTLWGPHDGSSPFEMAMSNAGFDLGRAIVCSAGNNNYFYPKPLSVGQMWHAIRNSSIAPSIQDTVEIYIATDTMAQPQGSDEHIAIQIWYEAGQDFYVGLITPSGDSCGHWGPNDGNAPPGQACPKPFGSIGIHNEDYDLMHPDTFPNTYGEITIDLMDFYMGYPLERGTWKITMDSGVGRWDTYIYFSNTHAPQNSGDYSYIPDFNNEGNIIEPGNAECLITVGAYSSKWEWRDADSLYQSDTSLLDPSMNVEDTCFFHQ
ncbi:MAG: S8 family serine peptidase, partial [candidate division Zixibacteria bacterium]|nr:S8 family serine peptidase [candidate division Zixibacteria bacterium]